VSKKKHPEHVNHERWLVSYADFITLLFASGQSDKHKQAALAKAMQNAFSSNGVFAAHSSTPAISSDAGAAGATPMPLALPLQDGILPDAATQDKIDLQTKQRIQDVIQDAIHKNKVSESAISVREVPEGIVVSLREGGFFSSGSADLRPEAMDVFNELVAALPNQHMRVEGHTDNIPIHTAQFATNWELSTARAATITRLLIADKTVDPAEISAAGYAEFHPVASNSTEEGRARNRRVDIILLRPATAPAVAAPAGVAVATALVAARPPTPAPSR
jgi:chemotaxis protein MotB